MTERRRFLIFLLVAGGLLGATAAVSYLDASGAASGNAYEKGVAALLLAGANVGNVKNYDERVLQKVLIQNDSRRIDTIVLGSSRAWQVNNCSCMHLTDPNRTFLNHAASLASLEDYIAILDLYEAKGALPRRVIIGADPWILNANSSLSRWKRLEPEYRQGLARIGVPDPEGTPARALSALEGAGSLISRDVVIASAYRLLMNRQSYFPTVQEELDVTLKERDGSIRYDAATRTRTPEEVDADARAYAAETPIFGLGEFTRIDDGARERFEATVEHLQARNTTVVLFLAPYHPIVYDTIAADSRYASVGMVESYLTAYAASREITVVGSYDPHRLNLSSADFYDATHPKREVVDRLFENAAGPGMD
ncbi:MAG: hypothetical protein ABFC89_08925 [Methanospirillum sp.]